jgi:ATP-dependent DNA ligase
MKLFGKAAGEHYEGVHFTAIWPAVPYTDAVQPHRTQAGFIAPMLLASADPLPEGPDWAYELKLDGYRAIGFKSNGTPHLRSRNNKNFDHQYPLIVENLSELPDETVVDGEVVALDETGRPAFSALQNSARSGTSLVYYVFDLMVLEGRDVMKEKLTARRSLLANQILPRLHEPIREAQQFDANLSDLMAAVRNQGLEGLVAKRLSGIYEPGERSGAWRKMRLNRADDFVIGGYTVGGRTFDALILGKWNGDQFVYVARTPSGFTPPLREALHRKFLGLELATCPFANLPERSAGAPPPLCGYSRRH